MSRKKKVKAYWEMTTEELGEATKQFDEEFVADKATPLTPKMKALWEKAKAKPDPPQQTIVVRIDKALLNRCTALAKKKHIPRDALIARGLHALLAAEGE
jgi:uncharacterized protein (DUF4415 family)